MVIVTQSLIYVKKNHNILRFSIFVVKQGQAVHKRSY